MGSPGRRGLQSAPPIVTFHVRFPAVGAWPAPIGGRSGARPMACAGGRVQRGAAMNDPRCLTEGPRGARPRQRRGPSPHGTPAPTASGGALIGETGAVATGTSGHGGTPGYREERKVTIRAVISWAERREHRWGGLPAATAAQAWAVRPTEWGPFPFLRAACREL